MTEEEHTAAHCLLITLPNNLHNKLVLIESLGSQLLSLEIWAILIRFKELWSKSVVTEGFRRNSKWGQSRGWGL